MGKHMSHGFKLSIGTNLIYLWCRAAGWTGRFNTISRPVFHGDNTPMPNSHRWKTDLHHICEKDMTFIGT